MICLLYSILLLLYSDQYWRSQYNNMSCLRISYHTFWFVCNNVYVFVLLLYVVLVSCFFFLVDCVYCYLFCLCVVLCSSGQGRTAVADCLEVKFINQIKSIHISYQTKKKLWLWEWFVQLVPLSTRAVSSLHELQLQDFPSTCGGTRSPVSFWTISMHPAETGAAHGPDLSWKRLLLNKKPKQKKPVH